MNNSIINKIKQVFSKSNKFDIEFARRLADKCRHSKEFVDFLNEKIDKEPSKLQLIAQIEDSIKLGPTKHDRDLPYDEQKWIGLIKDFFSKCMPQKSQEASQILDKTHPYFTDAQGANHVKFIQVQKGDTRTSGVGHCGENINLDFNVYIHGSIDDLRTIAHETSHALSSHHQHLIQLVRSNAPKREIGAYTAFKSDHQSIGEIESHITEELFNRYLLSKGIYDQDDMQNYEMQEKISLQRNINLIREETDVINDLNANITETSLNQLYNKYIKTNRNRLADRIEKMSSGNNSSHMFRYVVGRVVADRWIHKFDSLDKSGRENMLTHFQNYLDHTHEMTVDGACQSLLGCNFSTIAQDYIKANQLQSANAQQASATHIK